MKLLCREKLCVGRDAKADFKNSIKAKRIGIGSCCPFWLKDDSFFSFPPEKDGKRTSRMQIRKEEERSIFIYITVKKKSVK